MSSKIEPGRPAWRIVVAATMLTIVAAILRLINLDNGLWFDEIATLVEYVRLPLGDILTRFGNINNHPLYTVLAHLSVKSFGESAWSVRLPAFLFGLAGIPMLYGLGAAVASRREALLASALLAVSYHHIWFSQNARGYSALAFWTILSTLCLVRGIERRDRRWWTGYAMATALGVYTHLTMVFVTAGQALAAGWLLWATKKPAREWRAALLGFAVAGVLSLALLAPLLPGVFSSVAARPPRQSIVGSPSWAIAEAIRGLRSAFGGVGVVITGALALLGFASYVRARPFVAALMILPAIAAAAGTLALGTAVRPRFFFFLIGFLTLLVVRGAMATGERLMQSRAMSSASVGATVGTMVACLVIMVSASSLGPDYELPKQDFEGPIRFVAQARGSFEPVATAGLANFVYDAYYKQSWTPLHSARDLDALARHERVWVIYFFPEYLQIEAPDLMRALGDRCEPQARFAGTVGNGDVFVCAVPPGGP
ncbi:MAG: glycosyltransferase family 39 protein [Acidobacteria bacterium]|nr:glycosyltransferase family 39 protein [Acidobacteriota bacterium]